MQVSVVDRRTGAELPIYHHRGEYWVAGRPGTRYAIRARNMVGERVMAVMSVDGINVITGETASVEQDGYVFDAHERSDIVGWRKSDSQIAAFEFAAARSSYASRTGRPDDVGVLGIAVFRERMPKQSRIAPYHPHGGYSERDQRNESPMANSVEKEPSAPLDSNATAINKSRPSAPSPSLGTAHGRRETSYVSNTTFERAQSSPNAVIRIRYDSREILVAAGVLPVGPLTHQTRPVGPSPFPHSKPGYVPDPPPRY